MLSVDCLPVECEVGAVLVFWDVEDMLAVVGCSLSVCNCTISLTSNWAIISTPSGLADSVLRGLYKD